MPDIRPEAPKRSGSRSERENDPPGPKKYGECAIRLCASEMIENQLLVALSDKAKVAIVLDVDDLHELIAALSERAPVSKTKRRSMAHDLRQLRCAAFAVPIHHNAEEHPTP